MEAIPRNNNENIFKSKFEDIFRDKKRGFKSEDLDWSWLDNLTVEQEQNVILNLKLLSSLNGHKGVALRGIIQRSETPESEHLKMLLVWAKGMSSQGLLSGGILTPPPESIKNCEDNELYERVYFINKNPQVSRDNISLQIQDKFAQVLGISSDKWIDLIDPLFKNPSLIKEVIEKFGFIPEEIFTKKKFKSIDSNEIIQTVGELRKLENSDFKNESLRERARLINHFFISKRAETLRIKNKNNVSLDSNGILIDMSNFHSHIPYGLIDDRMIDELIAGNWVNQKTADEIIIMKSVSNNLNNSVEDSVVRQEMQFSESLGCKKEEFFSLLRQKGYSVVARKIIEKDLIIPIGWVNSVQNEEHSFLLLMLAETISIELAGADFTESGLSDYSTGRILSRTYDAQSKIVNGRQYYNISKLINCFLLYTPNSINEEQYAVVKSEYKVSNTGDTQSFVAAIYQDKIARVLVNERKHISIAARDSYGKIPNYSRKNYENLESSINVFHSFCNSLDQIVSFSDKKTEGEDSNLSTTEEELLKYIENCLHFVLTNVSEYYNQSISEYEKLLSFENISASSLNDLIAIFGQVKKVYSEFLYKNISRQDRFENNFSPEVSIDEINFGENFSTNAQELCPGKFDPSLSQSDFSVRVVCLDYKLDDPSQTIPFHIEESCLDALRINRQRPLINIIGGCKHLDEGKNPLQVFSDAIMTVAHKYRANVGVPGTQSGIGIYFGLKNIEYQDQLEGVPFAEKAHVFAINPGRSVYYPGNKFLGQGEKSIYANTTVDTLVTPIPAEWNRKGYDKFNSKYITHIAYMEALYSRMSINQNHIMVVGNGGLYSVMEINESLKRGVDLLLVKNTGRFAEAASNLMNHLDEILNSEMKTDLILKILKEKMDVESFDEFCKKDFGYEEIAENEDYEVYRKYFINFLLLAQKNKEGIQITELENLEQSLDNLLEK